MTPDEIGGAIIVGGTVASCMTLAVLAATPPTVAESTALVSSGMLGVSAAGAPFVAKPAVMAMGAKGLMAGATVAKIGAAGVTAGKVGALGLAAAGVGGVALVGLLAAGGALLVYKIVRK